MSRWSSEDIENVYKVAGCCLFILLIPVFNLALAWVVWKAWTLIGVQAFHWPVLTFWQVWWGTLALSFIASWMRRGSSS